MTLFSKPNAAPLAERLRPTTLEEVVGQDHVTGPGGPLQRLAGMVTPASFIFWGPPGCGKTTLARLIADLTHAHFEAISAVMTGVQDLRTIFAAAETRHLDGGHTLLFVDEIHRFNKAQQDAFLGPVEKGLITLIGATTENPSFALVNALLSRCQVLTLYPLDASALKMLQDRAIALEKRELPLTSEAQDLLFSWSEGDGRYFLNLLEQLFAQQHLGKHKGTWTADDLGKVLQRRAPLYDQSGEGHYNLISAFHKSLRGSDPDAALYWMQRMLLGGEDPRYLARRLIRVASEDVGLADPHALPVTLAAAEAYERLGSPEGELAIAQAAVYLATAPKSNALYTAFKASAKVAENKGSLPPPAHILNAPTAWMKAEGYGAGYQYDHDTPEAFSGQNYFPDALPRQHFYTPAPRGFEREIQKRLAYWSVLREKKGE